MKYIELTLSAFHSVFSAFAAVISGSYKSRQSGELEQFETNRDVRSDRESLCEDYRNIKGDMTRAWHKTIASYG